MLVNDLLKNKYGTNLQGKPLYRVVFSDGQTEKRFGVFNEFYGQIFLRQVRGLKEVPKYPWIKSQYILEKWAGPELVYDREIPETQFGSYEPVFVFPLDKEGLPLPPKFEVAEQIIWHLEHPPLPGHRQSEDREVEQKEFDREVQEIEDSLEVRSKIMSLLHGKEAIIRP